MKTFALALFCFAIALTGLVTTIHAQNPAPKEVKGGILNGRTISMPKPEYPAEAKAAGLEGMVFVDVVVDELGNVISAVAATEPRKTVRSKGADSVEETEVPVADPILRDSAERAAMKAKFSPVPHGPIKVSGTLVYNFVAKDTPRTVSVGTVNDKAINLPMPVYPLAAMAVRAQGEVVVEITIDEAGKVISATAVSGHPLLRAAAVEAAKAATFSPTLVNGPKIKVSAMLTYNFIAPKEDGN